MPQEIVAYGVFNKYGDLLYLSDSKESGDYIKKWKGDSIKPLYAEPVKIEPDVAGWRPIETAPKDGTKFLAICKTGRPGQFIGQCYYVGPDKRHPTAKLEWFMNLDGWPQPTHWMPLPASPCSNKGVAE